MSSAGCRAGPDTVPPYPAAPATHLRAPTRGVLRLLLGGAQDRHQALRAGSGPPPMGVKCLGESDSLSPEGFSLLLGFRTAFAFSSSARIRL